VSRKQKKEYNDFNDFLFLFCKKIIFRSTLKQRVIHFGIGEKDDLISGMEICFCIGLQGKIRIDDRRVGACPEQRG
jgi:hypothetical protein